MEDFRDLLRADLSVVKAAQLAVSTRIQDFARQHLVFVNPSGVEYTEVPWGTIVDAPGALVRRLSSRVAYLDVDAGHDLITSTQYWQRLCAQAMADIHDEVQKNCRSITGDREGRHLHRISGTAPVLDIKAEAWTWTVSVSILVRLDQTVYNCGVVGAPEDQK